MVEEGRTPASGNSFEFDACFAVTAVSAILAAQGHDLALDEAGFVSVTATLNPYRIQRCLPRVT